MDSEFNTEETNKKIETLKKMTENIELRLVQAHATNNIVDIGRYQGALNRAIELLSEAENSPETR